MQLSPFSAQDEQIVAQQLGRVPRGIVGVAWRNAQGEPAVVVTAPRLPDGTPFPTVYYLTDPQLIYAVSTLEGAGLMHEMNQRLQADPELARAHAQAHLAYLEDRKTVSQLAATGKVAEIEGISAGGYPSRVKCLHVLVAHALACGPGVTPLGDEALTKALDVLANKEK